MKRFILLSLISCFMVSMASAQFTSTRGGIKKAQTQQQYGTSQAQKDIKADRQFKEYKRSTATWHEVERARRAMDDAQRKVNDLTANRQAKIEKFNKKLEKISDPVKRASELKKFEEKMEKELLKAQEKFDYAQARYYDALDRYERGSFE